MDRSAIRRYSNNIGRTATRKAQRLVRISRKLKRGAMFKTGKGRVNRVVTVDEVNIYIKAGGGKRTVAVPLKRIVMMVAYFSEIRIVEREELWAFHSYNSALFGLLAVIYEGKSHINTVGNLLRLMMNGIRVFLAGGEKSPADLDMAGPCGARFVLFNHWYIRGKGVKAWKKYLARNNMLMILDCGTFKEWSGRQKAEKAGKLWTNKPQDIDAYCSFIKANKELIYSYFVFDKIGDYEQTAKNLRYMEEVHSLTPVPVYHMGTPIEVLDELVNKGYPVIALGGTVNQKQSEVKRFFQEVFNLYPTQAFHGLGVTKAEYLHVKKYPHLQEKGRVEVGGVAPTFNEDLIIREFGVVPHKGCSYELDHVIPDAEFYNGCDSAYIFTSRSCQNRCTYCCVNLQEPEYYRIGNWAEQINLKAKNVVICDNNLLATPQRHRQEVFDYLKQIAPKSGAFAEGSRKIRTCQVDGGVDWRMINEESIELMKGINWAKTRFAWDDVRSERKIDFAIRMLTNSLSQPSKRGKYEDCECYVLYGCLHTNGTLEDALYRAMKLYHHYNVFPYLMRYQPMDSLTYKTYVAHGWHKNDLIDLGRWANNRWVFPKVPRYSMYYGRNDDGTCYSKSNERDQKVFSAVRTAMETPLTVDFSKSFKSNLDAIRRELELRDKVMQMMNEKIMEQLEWFNEVG